MTRINQIYDQIIEQIIQCNNSGINIQDINKRSLLRISRKYNTVFYFKINKKSLQRKLFVDRVTFALLV
jgi:hypothetical protein